VKVLLVEDSEVYREQLANIIEALPDTEIVESASTAQRACEWLEAHPDDWDLAVIDIFLSNSHGFRVLQSCRARKPHQKAVVLTNYTVEPARHYARAAGADAFFDKAVDMRELVRFAMNQIDSQERSSP
jgi:DNA-binding NarL/FixJ family response regulator